MERGFERVETDADGGGLCCELRASCGGAMATASAVDEEEREERTRRGVRAG